MATPCWSPSGWALTQQAETKRNICHRVLLEKRKFIQRGIQKHESNTFSNTRNVQIAKFPEISHLFNQHGSTLGRHVNTLSQRLIFFFSARDERTRAAKRCTRVAEQRERKTSGYLGLQSLLVLSSFAEKNQLKPLGPGYHLGSISAAFSSAVYVLQEN